MPCNQSSKLLVMWDINNFIPVQNYWAQLDEFSKLLNCCYALIISIHQALIKNLHSNHPKLTHRSPSSHFVVVWWLFWASRQDVFTWEHDWCTIEAVNAWCYLSPRSWTDGLVYKPGITAQRLLHPWQGSFEWLGCEWVISGQQVMRG